MKKRKLKISLIILLILAMLTAGCNSAAPTDSNVSVSDESESENMIETVVEEKTGQDESYDAPADDPEENDKGTEVEKNGEIYILCTGDVHCGIDDGFGYAGLKQIRDNLEEQGYETVLVDDGDSIQGEAIGTLSKGESILNLMNAVGYDVAIPGNHEFDYGVDKYLELAKKAEFPYISCNFNYKGELVFESFVIKEVAGRKIAFVGVTTPESLTTTTPAYFQDDKGEYVYGFMQDKTGEGVYDALQKSVDTARSQGAELVYVIGHLGNETECIPWTYADVISNTSGIDVLLDGHSHDSDRVVMKNKDGNDVVRIAMGSKFKCIGYSRISAEGEIEETDTWKWDNEISAPQLLNINNDISAKVKETQKELDELLGEVVATTDVDLIIQDPELTDSNGKPVRLVRLEETNLGDLCADAYRDQSGADIAFVNGGGIRANIQKGDITYEDIINIHPYGNMLCVIEVTGQQILDALEWGSRRIPEENGAFIQVSGLSYEIRSDIDSPCIEGDNSEYAGIKGERRVQNVKVNGEKLDPGKTYTLAGHEYMILGHGDGYTMFDGSELLQDRVKLDNQVLIDYIVDTLGGKVGAEYGDADGQGRIIVIEP